MRKWLGCLALVAALSAADAASHGVVAQTPAAPVDRFKSEIDTALDQLKVSTNGVLRWEGADGFEMRETGGAVVAVITNARFAIRTPDESRLAFDRIEIRRAPESGDGNRVKLSMSLPSKSKLTVPNTGEMILTLKDATGSMVVENPAGRPRASELAWSGGRLEHAASGSWIGFGPLSLSSKVAAAAGGSWTLPTEIELKQIEFFVADGPVTGAIERVSYTAAAAGPSLASFDKARDDIAALRQAEGSTPEERLKALVGLLPELAAAFGEMKGEMAVEGVAVRVATGEPLVLLAKMKIAGALGGLSGDTAALRFTIAHDGLALSPAVLAEDQVPNRAVLDLGIENVDTAALRAMLDIAGKMQGASEAEQQQAAGKLMGAAAMLRPVLRVYDFALDMKEVGIDATVEAQGSPLSPKGYAAEGDVAVRGIDALPQLAAAAGAPVGAYLPLLKEMGSAATAADGTRLSKFHLVSAPQKWLTLNGNDITGWFADDKPGQPRVLRPAEPPIRGEDVRAVQRALAAAKVQTAQNGVYDGATAAAVARYQKVAGLPVNGVVDAATRDKLGVKPVPPPAKPAGPSSPRRSP